MSDIVKKVQQYYDEHVEAEWNRLERHPFEFALTIRMLDQYIKPGERVLDIGGGPGRYALYYAKKGCQVTLVDLSAENVKFAQQMAAAQDVNLTALAGDARYADRLLQSSFDHVLLMGPLYHLTQEEDRNQAIEAALRCLKPGGLLYVSFIQLYSGIIDFLKSMPESVVKAEEEYYLDCVRQNIPFTGNAFTEAYFYTIAEIAPFMAQFPLQQLRFFAQEGILAANELTLKDLPEAVIRKWLELAHQLCEREEFLGMAEHLMYIGRKTE
ncbi:MAG: class I SAM-dependent methyltransferase [Negativicutes bacterium]|nr:class I SAM-dependent methyltransferase [Negativicutes bacterium]